MYKQKQCKCSTQLLLSWRRVVKSLKLCAVLVLLGGSTLTASASNAFQELKVSLNLTHKTVDEALKEIQEQTAYSFFYESADLNLNKKVSINVNDTSVEEVMQMVLEGQNADFIVKDNRVIIVSKAAAPSTKEVQQQQEIKITGRILDESGETIPGATIMVKNGAEGTVTDFDGNYSLVLKSNATLVFSYIGYVSQEVKVNASRSLNVTLKEDSKLLDEVVVVGYGTQKKVNLTGAVATIDSKQLESRPVTSVSSGLQGLVPGMTITAGSGQPGRNGGTIRIRGVGTLNNSSPMVIVDGIENSMDNIDPSDIESISVLKDASSAAIYGSKAANGVILITTKKGSGDTKISYNGNFGWQTPTDLPKRLSSWEYAELYNEGLILDGQKPRFSPEDIQLFKDGTDPYGHPNTDWMDLLLKKSGFQHQHNVNISGSSDKIRYMASVGFQNQDGIIDHTSNKQYNARTNLEITPIKNLEVGLSLYFSNRDMVEPTNPFVGGMGQYFRLAGQMAPWIPYKYENGDYGTISDGNPIAWMDSGSTTNDTQRRFNAIGSVKYNFTESFSIKAMGSYRSNNDDTHEFRKDIWYNDTKYHGPNKMYEKTWLSTMLTSDIVANYDRSFGSHSVGAMAGFHIEKYDYKYGEQYRQDFPNNDLSDINAGSTVGQYAKGNTNQLNMLSYFGRVNYDYKGIYLFEANVRSDASSRFAEGHRWGVFPSFSAGWRISEEAFMEDVRDVVSNLKLRGSWGKLGNQGGLGYYPSIPIIGLGRDYSYPFGGVIYPGAAMSQNNKESISWEKTRTYGFGVDLGLFNDFNLSIDYYDRSTTGILMGVPAPATYGLGGYTDNIGAMLNRGLEVNLSYQKRFGEVDFGVSGNFAYNKNKITDLGEDNYIIDGDRRIRQVGAPANSFYGYKTAGLFKSQKEIDEWATYTMSKEKVMPGDLKYVDLNGDGKITADDRTVLGSSDPKYTFGLNLTAAYKGFDVQVFFQGAAGVSGYLEGSGVGEFVGDAGHPLTFWRDRWTPDNPNATVPRIQNNTGISSPNMITSDYWVQNANYLRLKNLQFGYTFPKKWISKAHINNLRVYYSGQNLLTFTSFLDGYDPETPSGSGHHYPQVKVNSIGVSVTF